MEDKIISIAKGQVSEFLTQLGLDAVIEVELQEADSKEEKNYQYLAVKLDGENLSELIGFHGKMLESIQNVLGLIINKELGDNTIRVLLDINNYISKRSEYLEKFALRAAVEVKQNKQPMELPPMKAFERRIIHMILKDDNEIETISEGEGEDRHIIITIK